MGISVSLGLGSGGSRPQLVPGSAACQASGTMAALPFGCEISIRGLALDLGDSALLGDGWGLLGLSLSTSGSRGKGVPPFILSFRCSASFECVLLVSSSSLFK